MIANYHTHTYRCGHASGDEREYIEKAIELGFCELGFSEHAPMPFPDGLPEHNLRRLLAMRMKMHETEQYISSLLSLREEYKNDVKIHIGFEVEHFDCCFDSFLEFISDYPVDYLIQGQHFGDPFADPIEYFGARTASDEALKNYADSVVKGLESGKISYLAHPDVINYCRSAEVYEREMTRIINCANSNKVPLEINFYGIQEVRNYPTLLFWQIADSIGCEVIFGSDAHKPQNLKNPYAVKYAGKMLESFKNLKLIEKLDFKPIK